MRNVSGSFYDFVAERFQGTSRAPLSEPPEAWGGRAAVDWARRLQSGSRFDPACSEYTAAAAVIDRIYSAA